MVKCCPTDAGYPCRRKRELAALVSRQSLIWTGPTDAQSQQKQFQQFLKESVSRIRACSGEAFFVAGPAEVHAHHAKMAEARGNEGGAESIMEHEEQERIRLCCSPGEQRRWLEYSQLWRERACYEETLPPFLADLEQNIPRTNDGGGGRSAPGEAWPVNLTHGKVYSFRDQRFATAGLAQGQL